MRDLSGQNLVWVWNLPNCEGGAGARIADRVLTHGATGIILKHDDGGRPFGLAWNPEYFSGLVHDLKARGLTVGLWGYHYDIWDTGLQMLHRAISMQPDFYVIDWEVELEQALQGVDPAHLRQWLYSATTNRGNIGLFHAPLAQPSYHQPWQYETFNRYCDGMMPQVYHQAMGFSPEDALSVSYNEMAECGLLTKPIYPIGQAYTVPAPEMTRWANAATRIFGAQGLSWWSYEHMDNERWGAISSFSTEEDSMRRVNGISPGWARVAKERWILKPGRYNLSAREDFGLLPLDRSAVLDVEFTPVDIDAFMEPAGAIYVIVRDGDGSWAGLVGGTAPWRQTVKVYMDATPQGRASFEVVGGSVRAVLVGILEAG